MRFAPMLLAVMVSLGLLRPAAQAVSFTETFESPVILDPPFTTPFLPLMPVFGWGETGPVTSIVFEGIPFEGRLDTGVFYNPPFVPIPDPSDPEGTIFIPNPEFIANAGDQVAFIGAIPQPVTGEELVSTYRVLTGTPYQANTAYSILLGVGKSGRQPPSNDATLAVEFIYDTGSGFAVVGSSLVLSEAQVLTNALTTFQVDLDPVVAAAHLGADIAVRIRPLTGSTGNWIFDNVQVVPEPASAALIAAALPLLLRRRR